MGLVGLCSKCLIGQHLLGMPLIPSIYYSAVTANQSGRKHISLYLLFLLKAGLLENVVKNKIPESRRIFSAIISNHPLSAQLLVINDIYIQISTNSHPVRPVL